MRLESGIWSHLSAEAGSCKSRQAQELSSPRLSRLSALLIRSLLAADQRVRFRAGEGLVCRFKSLWHEVGPKLKGMSNTARLDRNGLPLVKKPDQLAAAQAVNVTESLSLGHHRDHPVPPPPPRPQHVRPACTDR